ncbi:hypothetical protein ANCCEY_12252 [Ancylostoma ceylanicum]|uniref:Uncharacterized protein n=1 Tax=Ancylostoma ceylanicum TaxID=53326 RepID=A0A0D6LFE3_9BILA|nr:hypothetical protein ANCCEY_12252 [Ancylostoma ceylanicum]
MESVLIPVGSFPAKLPPGRTYGSAPYQHTMVKHPSIDGLKGATLRVIVPSIEPPYVNYANFSEQAEIEHGYGPGLVMELLKEMASLLDLKYEKLQELHTEEKRSASFLVLNI